MRHSHFGLVSGSLEKRMSVVSEMPLDAKRAVCSDRQASQQAKPSQARGLKLGAGLAITLTNPRHSRNCMPVLLNKILVAPPMDE